MIQRKFAAFSDDNNKLMSHNFAGCFYYNVGEVDSARTEFLSGYNLAKDVGDTIQLYGLALNTGTTYHDLSMIGSSRIPIMICLCLVLPLIILQRLIPLDCEEKMCL
jgi:hypothetical protein